LIFRGGDIRFVADTFAHVSSGQRTSPVKSCANGCEEAPGFVFAAAALEKAS